MCDAARTRTSKERQNVQDDDDNITPPLLQSTTSLLLQHASSWSSEDVSSLSSSSESYDIGRSAPTLDPPVCRREQKPTQSSPSHNDVVDICSRSSLPYYAASDLAKTTSFSCGDLSNSSQKTAEQQQEWTNVGPACLWNGGLGSADVVPTTNVIKQKLAPEEVDRLFNIPVYHIRCLLPSTTAERLLVRRMHHTTTKQ